MIVVIQTDGRRLDLTDFKKSPKVTLPDGGPVGEIRKMEWGMDAAGFYLKAEFAVTVPLYLQEDHNITGTLTVEHDGEKLQKVVLIPQDEQ